MSSCLIVVVMKLIVKHTEGKLPFIGVMYDAEENAIQAFPADLEDIALKINRNYGRISLRLYCKDKELLFHRLIEYNNKDYQAWRAYIHLGVNYGHCYEAKGELRVARSKTSKLCVLKLSKFIEK